MKPRYEIEILLGSPILGEPPYILSLDEETMTLQLDTANSERNNALPEWIQEHDACELQTIAARRKYAAAVVKAMYKGIKTSKEVKDADVDRIADILKILINTALPDME